MNLKSTIIAIFASVACVMASAQKTASEPQIIANEDSCSTESIQSAIDACLLLAESAESNDTAAIHKAKEALEECRLDLFGSLRRIDQWDPLIKEQLKGHLVFSAEFANRLRWGNDAYDNSDASTYVESPRGITIKSGILTKTVLIKANEKSEFVFTSRDRQELAVVAEPGGLVTTRIHAVNEDKGIDEWHNDTTDVAKGKNCRKTAFTLPHSPRSEVTLEIINCTDKDISVVVISN